MTLSLFSLHIYIWFVKVHLVSVSLWHENIHIPNSFPPQTLALLSPSVNYSDQSTASLPPTDVSPRAMVQKVAGVTEVQFTVRHNSSSHHMAE